MWNILKIGKVIIVLSCGEDHKSCIILSTQLSLAIEAFLDRYVPELSKALFWLPMEFGFRGFPIFARENENTDAEFLSIPRKLHEAGAQAAGTELSLWRGDSQLVTPRGWVGLYL